MSDDIQRDTESLSEKRSSERRGSLRLSAQTSLHHLLQKWTELPRSSVRTGDCFLLTTCKLHVTELQAFLFFQCRDFIEEGVVDYAKKNPGTVVYVSPQACNAPKLVAEYLNGNVREELISSKTQQQISEILTKLTNQSGLDIIRLRKPFHTDSPSIQGQWHPFTNRPPSIGLIKPPTASTK
uniref:Large ribosomal subunit protein mL43 n=1 Tax=Oryzias melastigma TaxID=30732 RepID=A0A3B3BGB8_ORYME